jgi:hypothetical protein
MEHARVTEGILPVTLNCDEFYVTGETWAKFHSAHPSITFDEFWTIKIHSYEKCNAVTKAFFTEFERDPIRLVKILADHALRP